MSETNTPNCRVVPDAELLRLIDDALPAGSPTVTHVRTCLSCTARLQRVDGRLRRLGEVLDFSDPIVRPTARVPVAASTRSVRLRRVALWLLLAAGVGIGAEPVRAWIVNTVIQTVSRLTGETPGVGLAPPEAGGTSFISFDWSGTHLELNITRAPSASVVIVRDAGTQVEARATGLDGPAGFVVLPEGLSVVDVDGPDALIILSVPTTVETLRVSTDGGIRRIELTALSEGDSLRIGG